MTIRLNKDQRIRVEDPLDVYAVMQQILLRQQKIDRNREHFWVVGLATDLSIMLVELISMGTVNMTLAEPMEVFSLALQKRCVRIVLVHNHPSGNLTPSLADKDTTDRLIQVGLIVNVPVQDHLIISEQSYYSFEHAGLMEQLRASKKYVPAFIQVAEARQERSFELAQSMRNEGYDDAEILKLTGLDKRFLQQLKGK